MFDALTTVDLMSTCGKSKRSVKVMFKTWAEVKNADWIYNNEDRRCKHKIFLLVGKTPGFFERKSVSFSVLVL